MGVNFNDLSDDPILYDRQQSCEGGMVSWPRANLIDANRASLLLDIDAENDKVTSNRRGFRVFGDPLSLGTGLALRGSWWFDSGPVQVLLAAAGSALWRMDSAHHWVKVSPTALPDASGPAYGAQVGNHFFLSSKTGPIMAWTGAELASGVALGKAITDGAVPSALLFLCAQKFRLFGVDPAMRDQVYCSAFLPAPQTPFTIAGQPILPFRIGEGEGDPIVALLPWKGMFALVAVKAGSIWIVDTTPAGNTSVAATITADFNCQQVSARVGSVASRSFARTGNDILFLSVDGVRSLARTLQDADGAITEPISYPITDWVRRINPAALAACVGTYWSGRYLLSVPIDESPTPTHTFVYNIRTQGWMVWAGVQPMAWVVATWRDQPGRLCCLDARGYLLEWRDWVSPSSHGPRDFLDEFTPAVDARIAWRIRTRAFAWGELDSPKHLDGVELEFTNSSARIDVDVLADNGSGVAILRNESTGFGELVLPFVLPAVLGQRGVKRITKSLSHVLDGREFIFELQEARGLTESQKANMSLLRLRSIQSGAFLETVPSQS